MPKLFARPLHRLHIMVEEDDHEWLKEHLAPGELSGLFRHVIKRLRGKKLNEPILSVEEILAREDLTL